MEEDILNTAAKDEAAAQKKEDRYRATRLLAQPHFQQQDGNGLQQVHPHSTGCKWTGFFSHRLPGFGMSTLCSCLPSIFTQFFEGHMRFSTVAEVRLVAALQLGLAPDEIRLVLPREGRCHSQCMHAPDMAHLKWSSH